MSTIDFHIWPGSVYIFGDAETWQLTVQVKCYMITLNLLITKFYLPCFVSQNLVSIWYSREEEKFEKLVGTLSLSGPGPGDPWRQWQRIVSQFYCLLSRLLSKQLWSAHTSQCTTLSLTLGFKLERETWGFKVQWFGHIILPSTTSPLHQYPECCILVLPPGCSPCPGKTCTLRRFYFKYLYVSGSLIKFIFKSLNLT